MKVSDLIEKLRTLSQDAEVGYINDCADYGSCFYSVENSTHREGHRFERGVPDGGAVVLE